MELRDLELLSALARHRHFARAAEECGISQPAYSARIHNLEHRLGAPMVRRGNRFLGFTPEGEIALKWARKMLADADGLRQEIEAARQSLTGRLTVGVVPTAIAFAGMAPPRLHGIHPRLVIEIRSASSSAIKQGIEDFSMDAGITYLDDVPPGALRAEPLYEERYVLLAPAAMVPGSGDEIGWKQAAALPLCLLSTDMANRRIVDGAFAAAGVEATPITETNAFTAALTQVASGAAATVAPEVLADSLPLGDGVRRLRLTRPVTVNRMALVTAERDPTPPALLALAEVLRDLVNR